MATEPETERILAEVLCGERPADDAEFVAWLAEDAERRERWLRMRSLASALDEMGSSEREVRTTSRGLDAGPDGERVAAMVRGHLGEQRRRSRSWRRWLVAGAAAAGIALLLRGALTGGGSDDPRGFEDVVLIQDDAVLFDLKSARQADGLHRLEWSDANASLGRAYVVHVFRSENGAIGAELAADRSDKLLETSWRLPRPIDDQEASGLLWLVEVYDAEDQLAATSAPARLSAP